MSHLLQQQLDQPLDHTILPQHGAQVGRARTLRRQRAGRVVMAAGGAEMVVVMAAGGGQGGGGREGLKAVTEAARARGEREGSRASEAVDVRARGSVREREG
eukprot:2790376-Prymnesium_polylepis.1